MFIEDIKQGSNYFKTVKKDECRAKDQLSS